MDKDNLPGYVFKLANEEYHKIADDEYFYGYSHQRDAFTDGYALGYAQALEDTQ